MHKILLPLMLCSFGILGQALPSAADPIQLGVSHSEFLPSVPNPYQNPYQNSNQNQTAGPNSGFDPMNQRSPQYDRGFQPLQQQAPQMQQQAPPQAAAPTIANPVIEWFPLPAGMAGEWFKRGDLTTSVTDLRTGRTSPMNQWTDNELKVTWGHQTDKQGTVWHANVLPNERDSTSLGKFVTFMIVSQKQIAFTPPSMITRTHMIVSEREGRNSRPTDVFQQEALNNMQVVNGKLTISNTTRVFTHQGQPFRDGNLSSSYEKIAQYQPTNNLSGIDLVDSLKVYLNSIGRGELAR